MNKYVNVNGKNLRCGYTTGTCACGAAMYATQVLLKKVCSSLDSKELLPSQVIVDTPSGIPVALDIHNITIDENFVSCSVIKDGGDDPDVTSGMHIFAKAEIISSICKMQNENTKEKQGVIIEGGEGIGIVTKPGLDQPVGNAAINSTPRKYITEIVESIKKLYNYSDTIKITIYAKEGKERAKKTFNERMGIEGGISIIGTSGIVEPMSNTAIVETTKLEINQRKAKGDKTLYIAPGRIGESFAHDVFKIDTEDIVLCSNNVYEAFENAIAAGFSDITFIGHIGKLVKLGYGAKNTHSANNDGRIEELILCALLAGANENLLKEISECVTTDGVISILKNCDLLDKTMFVLGDRIESTILRWIEGKACIRLCVFTNINNSSTILIDRKF